MVRELQIRYRNADGRADAGSLFSFSSARLIAFFPQISASPARTRERHKSFLNRAQPAHLEGRGESRNGPPAPHETSSPFFCPPPARGIDQIWQQSDVLTGEKALARNTIRTARRKEEGARQTSIRSGKRVGATKNERTETNRIFVILFSPVRSFLRSKIRRRHRDVIEADPAATAASGRRTRSQCTLPPPSLACHTPDSRSHLEQALWAGILRKSSYLLGQRLLETWSDRN